MRQEVHQGTKDTQVASRGNKECDRNAGFIKNSAFELNSQTTGLRFSRSFGSQNKKYSLIVPSLM
jgi:hypothetical protein